MALRPGQIKCSETFGVPLAVAAGAGSGKTFTLTLRIVRAFETGQIDDIGQILAITYTKKAAAELRDRVKAALRKAGRVEQALKVDGAWMSTIHGMCSRILREHALELGIDPRFAMSSEESYERYVDSSVADAIAKAKDNSPAQIKELFELYAPNTVRELVVQILGLMSASPLGPDAIMDRPRAFSPRDLAQDALRLLGDYAGLVEEQGPSKSKDAWLSAVMPAMEDLRGALANGCNDADKIVRLMAATPKPSTRFGSTDFKEVSRDALLGLSRLMLAARISQASGPLETLIGLARDAYHGLGRFIREQGRLGNNELISMASRALSQHPEIASLYQDKFKLVMVDEFQDTNQIQLDMIRRLSGEGCERLCVVGDSQQSIYRFQGADVGVYNRHVDFVREGAGKVIELSDNFRSHTDVLSFVDAVFGQDDAFGDSFMSLAPLRDEPSVKKPFLGKSPRVRLHLVTGKAKTPGASSACVISEQAEAIARDFREFKDAGHRASDMVVLLGRMTHAQAYADALEAQGLAAVVVKGSILTRMPEVEMICSLARVLANPEDGEAMLGLLQSSLFSLRDSDIAALSAAPDDAAGAWTLWRGLLRACEPLDSPDGVRSPAPSDQVTLAGNVIIDAVDTVRTMPVSAVVMRVFVNSGYITRMQGQGATGKASVANSYKVLRMIEDMEREMPSGARGIAGRLVEHIDLVRESPGSLSLEGNDCVKIMTIHASKGLEFPIVAVSELGERSSAVDRLVTCNIKGRQMLTLDVKDKELASASKLYNASCDASVFLSGTDSLGDFELESIIESGEDAMQVRAACQAMIIREDDRESVRLFYVALTRAKEALVCCLDANRTKAAPAGAFSGDSALVINAISEYCDTESPGAVDFSLASGTMVRFDRCDLPLEAECLDCDDGGSPEEPTGRVAGEGFFVPEAPASQNPSLPNSPFAWPRDDISSYSSLAAAGEGAGLALRSATAMGVPERDIPPAPGESRVPEHELFDDDADATDFGIAFHALAEYCARAHIGAGAIARPSDERIASIARAFDLCDNDVARLRKALDVWLSSEICERVSDFAHVKAEVPFMLCVSGADEHPSATASVAKPDNHNTQGPLFLEGEIDLLAYGSPATGAALVVDYKTGGHSWEGAERLTKKHALQAACYSLAVLEQGFDSVSLAFVRVEQPRLDMPSEPQVIEYAYTKGDVEDLRELASGACARRLEKRGGEVAECEITSLRQVEFYDRSPRKQP